MHIYLFLFTTAAMPSVLDYPNSLLHSTRLQRNPPTLPLCALDPLVLNAAPAVPFVLSRSADSQYTPACVGVVLVLGS